MTPSSHSDDEITSWIQEYNAMDPCLRSEFLEGWGAMVAANNRRRASRSSRLSANSSQVDGTSRSNNNDNDPFEPDSVVVVVRLPKATEDVEFLLDARGGTGRSWRYRSSPPPRGSAGTGPGRRRSGGRRHELRGRSDAALIRIVITLSEK
ncbi:hypothetical protein LO772_07715 [Yinghuangia sp. ASG 101]|uniref:hypothetical protein n=1 Tax=Yinghuangia sp. ASG 101 TaxID=2896848 RepID=UPI001E5144A3|nr:hypothetical protein [Yinghuangia sp. ASG 101]UGQ13483.1 hypothetical protein LO772_07715 [Yinghuangia sp. ASG 101]